MSILLGAFGGTRIPDPMSLSGSLSATGSTSTVTSTARTWTVPAGNDGVVQFQSVSETDITDFQYQQAGGGFVSISEGLEVDFNDAQSIELRITGAVVVGSSSATVTLRDKATGTTFGPYSVSRTS